jgi:hypothetical protein
MDAASAAAADSDSAREREKDRERTADGRRVVFGMTATLLQGR